MPILPKVKDGYILIPIITFIVWYIGWYAFCFAMTFAVGSTVITMTGFENIPEEYMVPTLAVIVATAFVLYLVFYLVSYQNKKSATLEAKRKALQEGKAVDEIEVARVETFHLIYKIAMVLGIIVTSAIAFVLMATVIGAHMEMDSVLKLGTYSAVATAVVFAIFDTFIGHPIADGTFKKKVLDPLRQKIIDTFQPIAESVAESVAELTDEQKAMNLMAQAFGLMQKK